MPLPNAPDYSKRIYELLKETDLENLSYAQFQGVAESLFIEPENEDEMRRLVLVQLARMAVRGDWDGFLTGGGGGGGSIGGSITNDQVARGATAANNIEGSNGLLFDGTSLTVNTLSASDPQLNLAGGSGTKSVSLECNTSQKLSVKGSTSSFFINDYSGVGAVMSASNDVFIPGDAPPFGGTGSSNTTLSTNKPQCYPFICAKSGNISTIQIRVASGATNNLVVGIFEDSGSGYPTNQLGGSATISTNSSGTPSASPSSTITLVEGTKYWVCYVLSSAFSSGNPTIWIHTDGSIMGWNSALTQAPKLTIQDDGASDNTLPTTMSTSGYSTAFNKKVRVGLEYA